MTVGSSNNSPAVPVAMIHGKHINTTLVICVREKQPGACCPRSETHSRKAAERHASFREW